MDATLTTPPAAPASVPLPPGVISSNAQAAQAAAPPAAMPGGVPPATPPPGDGITAFFKSVNWLEAGFCILGALGLYYTVYYYRYKLKEDKVANHDMLRQIDEVKMNLQASMKGKYTAN